MHVGLHVQTSLITIVAMESEFVYTASSYTMLSVSAVYSAMTPVSTQPLLASIVRLLLLLTCVHADAHAQSVVTSPIAAPTSKATTYYGAQPGDAPRFQQDEAAIYKRAEETRRLELEQRKEAEDWAARHHWPRTGDRSQIRLMRVENGNPYYYGTDAVRSHQGAVPGDSSDSDVPKPPKPPGPDRQRSRLGPQSPK